MTDSFTAILPAVAVGIGLFYLLGGLLFLRRLALDHWADALLSALGDADAQEERRRTRMLTLGAALTFLSGLALAALSPWSPAIFAFGVLFHAGYLLWAGRTLTPRDELERQGRRSAVNAFFIYLAAFAFVLFAHWQGLWRGWLLPGPGWLAALAELIALLGVAAALVRGLHRMPAGKDEMPVLAPREPEPDEVPVPERLRLAPEYRCWPTWSEDDGVVPVDPARLGLSEALVARIGQWNAVYQATYEDYDGWPRSEFPELETERRWVIEGKAIAAELAREWDGPFNDAISGLDQMLRSVRRDLSPVEDIPMDRAPDVGRLCRVAEIREVIERLDTLAREKNALPEWDGDSQDDVSRAQFFFARVLAAVPDRYLEEVRRGLDSPDAQTRARVELALQWREKSGPVKGAARPVGAAPAHGHRA